MKFINTIIEKIRNAKPVADAPASFLEFRDVTDNNIKLSVGNGGQNTFSFRNALKDEEQFKTYRVTSFDARLEPWGDALTTLRQAHVEFVWEDDSLKARQGVADLYEEEGRKKWVVRFF